MKNLLGVCLVSESYRMGASTLASLVKNSIELQKPDKLDGA